MSSKPRQKKADSANASELVPERQSAKDESSTIDGSALMAAIKTLEAGIHQKFDAHAAEFRKEILSLREEMHNSMVAVTSDVKAHEERLSSLESATSEWTTSLQLKFKDKNVHVFPDFPPEIAKKRAAYYDVKRLLRPRSDVKYGLRGLTGFRITYNNSEHIFDSPAEAMAFVKHRIIPD
ncbi:hypothetical protein DNTS_016382 [Danionella cerebrum]|uniref:Transposase element L1Md-A101/L1Md-A102/L1Md-A2 n=1 Tax=Danionella cerebrum TaxID=2873325 RepID=A0A553RNB0_9TELE|nr:hypothetical protein DNTS_016382 [Danionella translucida]